LNVKFLIILVITAILLQPFIISMEITSLNNPDSFPEPQNANFTNASDAQTKLLLINEKLESLGSKLDGKINIQQMDEFKINLLVEFQQIIQLYVLIVAIIFFLFFAMFFSVYLILKSKGRI